VEQDQELIILSERIVKVELLLLFLMIKNVNLKNEINNNQELDQ